MLSLILGCGQGSTSSDSERLQALETRVQRLEALFRHVPADILSVGDAEPGNMQNVSSVVYDRLGGGLFAFYELDSFDGKIVRYDVLKDDGTATSNDGIASAKSQTTELPNLRIVIASQQKLIVLNNFRVRPGATETIDKLMNQPVCRLPYDLWRIRSSALTD